MRDEPEEKEIDGKIQMIDEILFDLQSRRKELIEAREALKEEIAMTSGVEKMRGVGSSSSREEEKAAFILSSLQWKKFGPGKAGEWTFAHQRDGKPLKELDPIRAAIDSMRTGQQITAGDYRYKLSSDGKFLNRFPTAIMPKSIS